MNHINETDPISMSSLNQLRRRQESITEFRVRMQFENQLLPTFAKTLLDPKVIHNKGRRRRRQRRRLIQEHPFTDSLESQRLLCGHLPLAPTTLLLLLVFGFLRDMGTAVGIGDGRKHVNVSHHCFEISWPTDTRVILRVLGSCCSLCPYWLSAME